MILTHTGSPSAITHNRQSRMSTSRMATHQRDDARRSVAYHKTNYHSTNNKGDSKKLSDVSNHCRYSMSLRSSRLDVHTKHSNKTDVSNERTNRIDELPLLSSQLGVSKPSERSKYTNEKFQSAQQLITMRKIKQIERERQQRQERQRRLQKFQELKQQKNQPSNNKSIQRKCQENKQQRRQRENAPTSTGTSAEVAIAWLLMGDDSKTKDESSFSPTYTNTFASRFSKSLTGNPPHCNSVHCNSRDSNIEHSDSCNPGSENASAKTSSRTKDRSHMSRSYDRLATHMNSTTSPNSSFTTGTNKNNCVAAGPGRNIREKHQSLLPVRDELPALLVQNIHSRSNLSTGPGHIKSTSNCPVEFEEVQCCSSSATSTKVIKEVDIYYGRNDRFSTESGTCKSRTRCPDSTYYYVCTDNEDPVDCTSHNNSGGLKSTPTTSRAKVAVSATGKTSKCKQECPERKKQHRRKRLPKYLYRLIFSGKMSSDDSASQWKSAVDPRTGRTYYYHEQTRETQWRKPMELASTDERRAMEEKEKKQKDFFAAMEANILNSMSQGVIPGTPATAPTKKKSKAPPVTKRDNRPELVRTISTMDETVLTDLIRRQPSFRNISRETSLSTSDLPAAPGFTSFPSIARPNEPLDPLAESFSEYGKGEIFENLPNEGLNEGSLHGVDDLDGKLNQSSIEGFGLTWEETQALKKLAEITKEMAETEDQDVDPTVGAKFGGKLMAGETPSIKPGKAKVRDLPREMDFSDSDDESEAAEKDQAGIKKSTVQRALPRELDFSDSESDSDAPASQKPKSIQFEKEKKDMVRPNIKRRNTCGTLYVGTTMSAPDKDATIKCVSGVYRAHILSSDRIPYDSVNDQYMVFNDQESEQGQMPFTVDERPATYEVPTLDQVSTFYRDIFFKAQMEADCIIMSLIYVERLIKRTAGLLRPRASNWRSLLFSCMILSSKVWDDLSMWNVDFSQSCPPGVSFPLQRINQLELSVLNALTFQVKVPASEYAKYYFLLRSMLIKSGLGGDEMSTLNPLDVEGARKLQHVSSQFEHTAQSKSKATLNMNNRSKSLGVADRANATQKMFNPTKVGLEHVVKM